MVWVPNVISFVVIMSSLQVHLDHTSIKLQCMSKGGVEGPAGPAIAVPLFLAVHNAGALFTALESRPYIM